MCSNEPLVAPRIFDRAHAVAVWLIGRRMRVPRTGGDGARVERIAVVHVKVERRRGPEPLFEAFADAERRAAEADDGERDEAIGGLVTYLRGDAECRFEERNELRSTPVLCALHVELRRQRARRLGTGRLLETRGDVPLVACGIGDEAGALAIRLIGRCTEVAAAGINRALKPCVDVRDVDLQADQPR